MKFSFIKFILPMGLALAISVPAMADFSMFDYSLIDTGIEANENTEGDLTNEELADNNSLTNAESSALSLPPLENHYIQFEGVISEVTSSNDRILVEGDNDVDIYYNISGGTLLYSLNSMEPIAFDKLSAGRRVSVFYNVYTPQAMSLPPQITPEVIVIHDNEETAFAKVDYFDENALSSDKTLKLNANEEMLILGTDNKLKTFDDAKEQNLLVFYSTNTRTAPYQVPPVKIVVLNSPVLSDSNIQIEETEITPEETAPEEGEGSENSITNEDILAQLNAGDIITKGETRFIALYKISEILGYELTWDSDTAVITLRKEGNAESYTIKNDTTEYGYNRALLHFVNPPFINNSRTYVEEAFLDIIK